MNAITRRNFLQTTAAGAAVLSQFPTVLGADEPERKIKLGLIGCGWYGMVDMKAALKAGGVEPIALCDVDSDHLTQSAAEVEKLCGKRPQTFKLYEELLKGTPMSRASALARAAARDADDPTWLAYVVYARPDAVLATG